MSAEMGSAAVNGNYTPNNGHYDLAEHNNHVANTSNSNTATSGSSVAPAGSSQSSAEISKDEVGWYFVEQYYTTLSKTPEKLFLFYNKRSQSVSGVEEEKTPIAVGQKAINDMIKAHDWQDAKVRVTNVDSQGSDQNIIIQVIGEISNKSATMRRFVQTFVLATQTNGYFVLNDIFRFLAEEPEDANEEELQQNPSAHPSGYQEPTSTAMESEPKRLTDDKDTVAQDQDANLVDEKLEEDAKTGEVAIEATPEETAPVEKVNGTVAEAEPEAEVHKVETPLELTPEKSAETSTSGAAVEAEKPTEAEPEAATSAAEPTAAPSGPKAAPPKPAAAPVPAKPAAPKSWASLVSAGRTAPAVPNVAPTSSTPAASKPTPTAPSQAPGPTDPSNAVSSAPAREATPDNQQDVGWQSVGGDGNRKQTRGQGQTASSEPRGVRGFVKNVFASVDAQALRTALEKFGEVTYFDISRQKNCAFVEFATPAIFQAAQAANPIQIGTDQVYVEERREGLRASSNFNRGGGSMRGRGGPENRPGQGRGGFPKDGGRGGFPSRGRGNAPRGRGASQVA
ncbi:hypothetical protein K402DRAFT_73977 [Aulographum hederae CBS 113979]|uniref:NTF2-domain-containing protein n=1 Tax=Aulographum hederae CBS 113979 TaxID=1176131 RepID=A0A6G1HG67_9PEZI|nr:hypothetical protein K402DRAFT_73977 [Aulographum hederae CBS 113979]